jgi:SAM-dependent methyltransferase
MKHEASAHQRPPDAASFFDAHARQYDGDYDKPAGYALRSRLQAVLELLEGPAGDVLDAGMGAGRLLGRLADRGWNVSGIDASHEMVVAAKQHLGHDADLRQAVIEQLPFESGTFDAVVATGVLEYAVLETALRELARVLRPTGIVIVSYPNPGNVYWTWRSNIWYPAVAAAKRVLRRPPLSFPESSPKLDATAFRRALASAGLVAETTRYTSYLVVPAPFDELFPRTAERLGRALERRSWPIGRRFAGQIVYCARRESPRA